MKTLLFFLVTAFAILNFGCEDTNNSDFPSEGKGVITETEYANFKDTISLGETLSDSISILYYDSCNERSYFKVIKVSEFKYNFELWDIRSKNVVCLLPLIPSKAPFSFTPTQKGTYTLHLIDNRDTISKTLVVN